MMRVILFDRRTVCVCLPDCGLEHLYRRGEEPLGEVRNECTASAECFVQPVQNTANFARLVDSEPPTSELLKRRKTETARAMRLTAAFSQLARRSCRSERRRRITGLTFARLPFSAALAVAAAAGLVIVLRYSVLVTSETLSEKGGSCLVASSRAQASGLRSTA